jgi:hypothetical protein
MLQKWIDELDAISDNDYASLRAHVDSASGNEAITNSFDYGYVSGFLDFAESKGLTV